MNCVHPNFTKQLQYFFGIIGLTIVLISCGATSKQDNMLRVSLNGTPDSLDPHKTSATITHQVTSNIYDTLVTSSRAPALATDWNLSVDGTALTFTLRKDVLFHHGKQFTAEDVLATFNRLRNADSPFINQFDTIKNIIATDDYTIKVLFNAPYAGAIALFATKNAAILPKDLIESEHNFSQEPVGTGAFKFESWVGNNAITLSKNTNHYRSTSIDGIIFLIMGDMPAQMQALLKGEIDIVPYVGITELSTIKNSDTIHVEEKPGSTILVMAMNTRHPNLANKRVRRAIAQAIDKQRVLDVAYSGGKEVNVFWSSNSPYYIDVPFTYEPKASKEFFMEHPIDTTLTITVPQVYELHVNAAQIYQQLLDAVGVKTKIKQVDWPTWINQVYRKGNFELTVIGHTGKLDPDQRLRAYGEGKSYVGWINDTFVSLVTKARIESNQEKRIQLYQKALTLMTEEYPFVFVGERTDMFAVRNRVQSFEFDNVLGTYDFRDTVLSNE